MAYKKQRSKTRWKEIFFKLNVDLGGCDAYYALIETKRGYEGMKKETADKLKEIINEYCDSKIEYSWIGSHEIEDQITIEDNVKISLNRLNNFIEGLIK